MNEGDRTVYNVVPVVTETTGMKRIYISPSVMVEQIAPHNGVKYTASISAGERIKTGNITIRVAVANGNGQQYDRQEFALPTERETNYRGLYKRLIMADTYLENQYEQYQARKAAWERERKYGKKKKSVHPRPLPQHNEEEVVSDPEEDNSSPYINTDNDNLIDD